MGHCGAEHRGAGGAFGGEASGGCAGASRAGKCADFPGELYAGGLDSGVGQFTLTALPGGSSPEAIRNAVLERINGMSEEEAANGVVHAYEQSIEVLKQAGIAAATLGASQVLSAARASQYAYVAYSGQAGQAVIGRLIRRKPK
jgi:hypothetical protein